MAKHNPGGKRIARRERSAGALRMAGLKFKHKGKITKRKNLV